MAQTFSLKKRSGYPRLMSTSMEEEKVEAVNKQDTSLSREITLSSGVALVVGQIIGSGIFITSKSILNYAGSFGATILMWIFGAVVAMAGSLCYIELGLLVKGGGGECGYLTEAYSFKKKNKWCELLGSILGFLFVWSNVCVLRPASLAIQSLTCAHYLTKPFSVETPDSLLQAVAVAALVGVAVANSVNVKTTANVVRLLSTLKIVAVIFVAVVGVFFTVHKSVYPEVFSHPFRTIDGHVTTPSTIALAMYGVLWSYDGWNVMNYALEETKDVKRTLPLSLLIGIPVVALCYLIVNFSFFAILSYEQILQSDTVALPFGDITLGKVGAFIIPLLVAISTFGSLVGSMFTASRIVFSAARRGFLPEFLSGIHKDSKTPVAAIITLLLAGCGSLVLGDISELIECVGTSIFLFYLLVIVGLIIMRFTHADEPRIFRGWFIFPVAAVMIVIYFSLVFLPLFLRPIPSIIALSVVLLGVPVYVLLVAETPWRLRPVVLDNYSGIVTKALNALLNAESTRT